MLSQSLFSWKCTREPWNTWRMTSGVSACFPRFTLERKKNTRRQAKILHWDLKLVELHKLQVLVYECMMIPSEKEIRPLLTPTSSEIHRRRGARHSDVNNFALMMLILFRDDGGSWQYNLFASIPHMLIPNIFVGSDVFELVTMQVVGIFFSLVSSCYWNWPLTGTPTVRLATFHLVNDKCMKDCTYLIRIDLLILVRRKADKTEPVEESRWKTSDLFHSYNTVDAPATLRIKTSKFILK
jgi:hypothetical protein